MPTENVRKPRTESCKLVLLRDHHTTTTPTTLVVFFQNKNFQIRVTNLCCFRGSHPDNKKYRTLISALLYNRIQVCKTIWYKLSLKNESKKTRAMKQSLEKTRVLGNHITFVFSSANTDLREWWHEKGRCGVVSLRLTLTKKILGYSMEQFWHQLTKQILEQICFCKKSSKGRFSWGQEEKKYFYLKQQPGLFLLSALTPSKILDYWETLQILHEEKLKNQQLEETGLPNLGKTISQVWKPISLFFPIFLIWFFSFGFTEVSIHKRSN